MDFILIKSLSRTNLDIGKFELDLYPDQITIKSGNYVLITRKTTQYFLSKTEGVVVSGRIMYGKQDNRTSLKTLLNHLFADKWPLPVEFYGCFSGVAFNDSSVILFNDPLGLYKLFYSITKDYVVISTSLTSLKGFINCQLKMSSLLQEITGPEYSQYGRNTVLKDVFSLMPGELVHLKNGVTHYMYDTTIKEEDKEAGPDLAEKLVQLIDNEFHRYYTEIKDITISMSGGVDSRVLLAPFLNERSKNIVLSNYGQPHFIDSSIPIQIARRCGYYLEMFDPVPNTFPDKRLLWDIIGETDSLHVSSWLTHILNCKDHKKGTVFLLGDMCDILRSKGSSSLKSRSFRKSYYKNRFLKGGPLKLTPLTKENKQFFINQTLEKLITEANIKSTVLKPVIDNKKILVEEIESDIMSLFSHLEKYNPCYLESYEELYGIFTHGRRSMGKQLNLLKKSFSPEIPLLSLPIIREIINYSPTARFADELVFQMFRVKSWKTLGRYPTAQNPFIPYNSNYNLMLLGWYIRSSIDQSLMKQYVKSNGKSNRQRLFKNLDSQVTYTYPGALENFKSYFQSGLLDASGLIEIFKKRANKQIWPLSSMDLTPYIQAEYYLSVF